MHTQELAHMHMQTQVMCGLKRRNDAYANIKKFWRMRMRRFLSLSCLTTTKICTIFYI